MTAPEPFMAPDATGEAELVVNLEAFTGPIDLLLTMAREQKVDLAKISVLQLADQFIAYISQARRMRLEVAADYLVMAAWLAYLKSRLLLPKIEGQEEEPTAEQMTAMLKFHMMRLEAMQKAAAQIQDQPQVGRDVFMRGGPNELETIVQPTYFLTVNDLLTGISASYRRRKPPAYALPLDRMMTLEGAMARLRAVVGQLPQWMTLTDYLPDMVEDPLLARSALAATFAATLELVRLGEMEIQQDGLFQPIYLRRRQAPPSFEGETDDHNGTAAAA